MRAGGFLYSHAGLGRWITPTVQIKFQKTGLSPTCVLPSIPGGPEPYFSLKLLVVQCPSFHFPFRLHFTFPVKNIFISITRQLYLLPSNGRNKPQILAGGWWWVGKMRTLNTVKTCLMDARLQPRLFLFRDRRNCQIQIKETDSFRCRSSELQI